MGPVESKTLVAWGAGKALRRNARTWFASTFPNKEASWRQGCFFPEVHKNPNTGDSLLSMVGISFHSINIQSNRVENRDIQAGNIHYQWSLSEHPPVGHHSTLLQALLGLLNTIFIRSATVCSVLPSETECVVDKLTINFLKKSLMEFAALSVHACFEVCTEPKPLVE